jgi:hypothetical protein
MKKIILLTFLISASAFGQSRFEATAETTWSKLIVGDQYTASRCSQGQLAITKLRAIEVAKNECYSYHRVCDGKVIRVKNGKLENASSIWGSNKVGCRVTAIAVGADE